MRRTGSIRLASVAAAVVLGLCLGAVARAADWQEVQKLKAKYVAQAVQHAMEQQRTSEAKPAIIPMTPDAVGLSGGVTALPGASGGLGIEVKAEPGSKGADLIRIKLVKPMDMVSEHSGLAFTVKTESGSSPEVRVGCRLITSAGKTVQITPVVPAVSRWGENPHEIYLDWGSLDYADQEAAFAALKDVATIEITFGAIRRAPQRGPSEAAQSAKLTISDLRLVDYLKGSYDPSRQWKEFDEKANKWLPTGHDLTLQHRCQEVTSMVAIHGGEAGLKSAADALDMAVRTQCWDGSFLDGRRGARTVASGEYTFGFTIVGMLNGWTELERVKSPALDEKITIGPSTMTRREWYAQMFYRAALARGGIATATDYRDDIIGGNTLITGANRVLGYAIAMRMVAEALSDPAKKKEILDKYAPFMKEIAEAQGKFSGGFPVLGEGDMYGGKGIHYDAGYTRTHMDWLITGVVRTGDPLLVEMLRKYQDVFVAAMDERGQGILPMISERHQGADSVDLIMPDATWQVGVKYKLPIIAQWGYNCGVLKWLEFEKKPGNHFTYAGHVRGYPLGAHIGRLIDDMAAEPEPKDLGYLFPRQFPIWTTRVYAKDGNFLRTTKMEIGADGKQASDYFIGVGEFPATVGVPVLVKTPQGKVTAVAEKLSGWPKLLPEGSAVEIAGEGLSAKGKLGGPIALTLQKETKLVITGPEMTLPPEAGGAKVPFRAELTLTPEKPGLAIELTVLRGTAPYECTVPPPASAPARER
jgi:hypothetical protein